MFRINLNSKSSESRLTRLNFGAEKIGKVRELDKNCDIKMRATGRERYNPELNFEAIQSIEGTIDSEVKLRDSAELEKRFGRFTSREIRKIQRKFQSGRKPRSTSRFPTDFT